MNENILIYGAGAIGRGFLAPIFDKLEYDISFIDVDRNLIEELKKRKSYSTAFAINGRYVFSNVKVKDAYHIDESEKAVENADYVFVSVGPRNAVHVAEKLRKAKKIFCFENERESAAKIREISGVQETYFGIPDVIASSTAPKELLEKDSLCVVCEDGDLIIEKGNYSFPGEIKQVEVQELDKNWACKFYLHNTPHALTAYLGAQAGIEYIHEAMALPHINNVVAKAINDIKEAIVKKGLVDSGVADWYVKRELNRFRDVLLYDPIVRVAREPLRKLRHNDRLISVCRMLTEENVNTASVCKGIVAAFKYDDEEIKRLIKKIGVEGVLKETCKLNSNDILYKQIMRELE